MRSLYPCLVLAVVCCANVFAQDAQREQQSQQATPRTISLTIDYGDGSQKRFPKIDWSSEQRRTVADALEFARQHARGITVTARGKGETRFLEAIDQVTNEGAGGKNWMFSVNGELAKSSFATVVVEPGADILWEFRAFQYNAESR